MAWIYLIAAGLLEIGWAILLKRTDGFTRPGTDHRHHRPLYGEHWLLSLALRSFPTSTGYAVWVGIGAVGMALVGLLVLGEPANALRLVSIALIVLGVIGLRFAERRGSSPLHKRIPRRSGSGLRRQAGRRADILAS